jgi:hypothetical protein
MMGIVYDPHWQGAGGNTVSLWAEPSGALNIDGYQHLLRGRSISSGSAGKEYTADGIAYRVGQGLDTVSFYLTFGEGALDTLQLSLRPLVDKLVREHGNTGEVPPDELSVSGASSRLRAKICLRRIRLERKDGELRPVTYEAEILYSIDNKKE